MQSKPFQVLSRNQNVHSSYLLEASAGTGKTYSIENIVVRLLIDEEIPCTLENILVVTFTKAATADLKFRIRQNIQKALFIIRANGTEEAPDYLIALLEKCEASQNYARRQLEDALACFEQASVFTIHGFCHRMLKEYLFEADASASSGDTEGLIAPSVYARLIKDFFRTGLSENLIGYARLKHLLGHCKGVEGLEKELYGLVTKGISIAPGLSGPELVSRFCSGMTLVKSLIKATPEQIVRDFLLQAPFYTGICNLQKKPKEENVSKAERFAALFAKNLWNQEDFDLLIADGLYLVEALDPSNLGKKKQPPSADRLHCPELISMLSEHLGPCIMTARNVDYILASIACKCKELVHAYLELKEVMSFDDLLTHMDKAVGQPSFARKIRQRFTSAVIDEFQDTDPIQWRIFKSIFLTEDSKQSRLYLVGDPKQSIYGFRRADIYTYLSAGEALGPDARASLETNYRSTEPLINALNLLFSSEIAPGLIALPHLKETIPYRPVIAGGQVPIKAFDDDRGAVHFFSFEEKNEGKGKKMSDAEDSFFLPFIVRELRQLHARGTSLSSCAILVADRFQAGRLGVLLREMKIPFVAQHTENLVETLAFGAMKELLQAILNPQKESSLKIALGGPIFGWSQSEVSDLADSGALEESIAKGMNLRKIWRERGFSPFYNALMISCWSKTGKTVGEVLLLREGGIDLYHGMQQLAEFLIEKEMLEKLPPFRMIRALDELVENKETGDESVKLRSNPEKEGVRILTIHSSKGLEFEIVFALGVIKRSKKPSLFIPIVQENEIRPVLTPIENESDPRYVEYLSELDAEKIRQLYVAFTRAKQRLYVPLFFEGSGKPCKPGMASSMELYLALMGKPQIPIESIYERIPVLNQDSSFETLRQLASLGSITFSSTEEVQSGIAKKDFVQVEIECILKELPNCIVPGNPLYMHSFTALAKGSSQSQRSFREVKPPNDFEFAVRSSHTLPAGSHTGSLLHAILETIPFNIVSLGKRNGQLLAFVDKYVSKTPFKGWREVIADILYNALTVELPVGETSFCLKDLTEDCCYREHEFMYSSKGSLHPEFEARPGFVKGVIDLIFECNGKFCILDWKTNWLGPDESCYAPLEMERAMHENDYYLQADIYREALRRYLKLIDERPFEEIFGGVFYIFLRGSGSEGVMKAQTLGKKADNPDLFV